MAQDEKKIWKKDEIRDLLMKSDKAVSRGLVMIYSLQTDSERNAAVTVEKNGVGFNGLDAEFLSSLAVQVIEKGGLSPKQLFFARKKILKYADQLTKISNGKIQVTAIDRRSEYKHAV